jgi:hypothetical protein
MLPYSVIHTIAWEMPGHDFVLEKKKRNGQGPYSVSTFKFNPKILFKKLPQQQARYHLV